MSKRRTRITLANTRAQVLYSPAVDRVTIELRYKNLPSLEASYSQRARVVQYIALHLYGQSGVDLIKHGEATRMQIMLDQAVRELEEMIGR